MATETPRATWCVIVCAAAVAACHGQSGPPAFTPVASTRELMDGIVIPYSQTIFDAVAYENAQLTRAPRNDDEWYRLKVQALAVAEAGNLLMMPPRAKDDSGWPALAHDMTVRAADVAKAAERKDVERVLETGGQLYETCTACHAKYVTP